MVPASDNWFAVYQDEASIVSYKRVVAWLPVEDRHTEAVGLVTSTTTPAVVKATEFRGLIAYRYITNETFLQAIIATEVADLVRAAIDQGGQAVHNP
jgi:predicted DNA repair protein MutK